jgi:hypothetical protein
MIGPDAFETDPLRVDVVNGPKEAEQLLPLIVGGIVSAVTAESMGTSDAK